MVSTHIFCAILAFVSYASARGYGTGAGGLNAGGLIGHGSYGAGVGGYRSAVGQGGAAGYGGIVGHGTGAGYVAGVVQASKAGYGVGAIYGGGQEISFVPKPYDFAYDAPDGFGNSHFRREQADGNGNVQGSYGYTDSQGLYRQVDYVANAAGFRANVRTNEPGTDGKVNPADVTVVAQPSPPGVQERYTRPAVYGGGAYGSLSHGGAVGLGTVGAGHAGSSGYGAAGAFRSGQGYGAGGNLGASGVAGLNKFGGIGGAGLFAGVPRSSSGKSGY